MEIDYVTSSVGSLNIGFLNMLHLAAQGDDGLTEYNWRTQKTKDSKTQAARTALEAQTESGFRIFYPSEQTVKASTGGPENAGTICFQSKWWNSPSFPKKVMRDCISQRRGLLMHNKIIFAREKEEFIPDEEGRSKAWVYVGSANCSESAWGKLVMDKGTKGVKLNCRNWECGVVVPLRRARAMGLYEVSESHGRGKGKEGLGMLDGVLTIPMQYEDVDVEYRGKKPWFYVER
ncbi:MAG: hypothetical protein Q9181_008193 [Wetmoreana brouardii]